MLFGLIRYLVYKTFNFRESLWLNLVLYYAFDILAEIYAYDLGSYYSYYKKMSI